MGDCKVCRKWKNVVSRKREYLWEKKQGKVGLEAGLRNGQRPMHDCCRAAEQSAMQTKDIQLAFRIEPGANHEPGRKRNPCSWDLLLGGDPLRTLESR